MIRSTRCTFPIQYVHKHRSLSVSIKSPKLKRCKTIQTRSTKIVCKNHEISRPFKEPKNSILAGMLFCNLLFYTLVRDMKDVILVSSCGAEAIPFMKTWVNFPISFFGMFLFNKLYDNGHSLTHIYRMMYPTIALLYCFIGIVLFPNRLWIQPHFHHSFIGVQLINQWVSTCYYAFSSIWGSIVISLLFWSIANRYTSIKEAKVIYPLFGFVGNIALIIAGFITKTCIQCTTSFNQHISVLMSIAFCFVCIHMLLFETLIQKFPEINASHLKTHKKSNENIFSEVFTILHSPFIRNMVIMISCYGSSFLIFETVWKHYIRLHFDNPILYANFMGTVSSIKGILTMLMMLLSSSVFNNIPLPIALGVTPICICSLGGMFFYTIHMGAEPIVIVYIGGALAVLAKSLKYAFFDPNKEIAYMYVPDEMRLKGKATIDVLSNPMGKSGTSLLLQSMFLTFGNLHNSLGYITIVFMFLCISWLQSIRYMKKLHEYASKKENSKKIE